MIKVFSVQTFYGTREKTFINYNNAINYYSQLCRDIDPDLIEFNTLQLTDYDFIYTDFSD